MFRVCVCNKDKGQFDAGDVVGVPFALDNGVRVGVHPGVGVTGDPDMQVIEVDGLLDADIDLLEEPGANGRGRKRKLKPSVLRSQRTRAQLMDGVEEK